MGWGVVVAAAAAACKEPPKAAVGDAGRTAASAPVPAAPVESTPAGADAGAAVASATGVDAGADADVMQMFDEAITMLEAVGRIVQANMSDCKVMGDKLVAYHEQHADFVTRVGNVYDEKRGEERKAIQARFRRRFHAAWKKISPGMIKCRNDPNVKKVTHAAWGDSPDPPVEPPQGVLSE